MNAPSCVMHFIDGASPRDGLVRLLCADLPILKGFTWRRIGYTLLVAAAFAVWTTFGVWMMVRHGPAPKAVGIEAFFLHERWGWLHVFRVYLCLFFWQMVALTFADNMRAVHAPRRLLLVVAFALGTAIGSVDAMMTGDYLDRPPVWGTVWGGLVAFVYFKRRHDEELAAALHATQLAHVELKKKTLNSQLQLMQARIEPPFLLNTLQRIRDLYETDCSLANRMLDNLIVYLRAALPQMRTSTSTLGQEVRLAAAYLAIERTACRGAFDFAFDVPEAVARSVFPPMTLLPLIEAFIKCAKNARQGSTTVHTHARARAGVLELSVEYAGSSFPAADDVVASLTARLRALYGADGKLAIECRPPLGAIARLQVPHAYG